MPVANSYPMLLGRLFVLTLSWLWSGTDHVSATDLIPMFDGYLREMNLSSPPIYSFLIQLTLAVTTFLFFFWKLSTFTLSVIAVRWFSLVFQYGLELSFPSHLLPWWMMMQVIADFKNYLLTVVITFRWLLIHFVLAPFSAPWVMLSRFMVIRKSELLLSLRRFACRIFHCCWHLHLRIE